MNGLVSIIMPSYNTASYISESIESVLRQTYANWELIIVDDCSTDETYQIVKPYLTDKRIRFLSNQENVGAAISRNRAIREAAGKWIAFLDSDDLWAPQKLEKQILFMELNGYHFSYTKYEEINMYGVPLGIVLSGPQKITKAGFFNYCWPGCLTVIYDREIVGCIQIADLKKNNDYAMWLKVCKKVECYLLEEKLAYYRRGRTGSISTQGIIKMIAWHYKLFRISENQSILCATFNTGRNLLFGTIKKVIYTKKE